MFKSPVVRLIGRALMSGALAAGAVIYASNGNVDRTVALAALVAAVHAMAEYFTPLNAVVGVLKDDQTQVVIGDLLDKLGAPSATKSVSKKDVIKAAKAVAK